MKKYIFPIGCLLFVIVLVMVITNFTQSEKPGDPKIIPGWKHVTFDHMGNSYYIDPNSMVNDGQTGDELRFHATFQKFYSERGREEFAKAYSESITDMAVIESIDHEIDVLYFRDLDGIKFVTSANAKFYKADGTEIPALNMAVSFDEGKDFRPIPSKTIGERLYDYAYTRVSKD